MHVIIDVGTCKAGCPTISFRYFLESNTISVVAHNGAAVGLLDRTDVNIELIMVCQQLGAVLSKERRPHGAAGAAGTSHSPDLDSIVQ